jgi:hypothetical protein
MQGRHRRLQGSTQLLIDFSQPELERLYQQCPQ